MAKPKDLTNQKFGELVAVEMVEKRINGAVVWKCNCSCGRTTEVRSRDLSSGNTRSCGCLKSGNRKMDLTNKRFGRLLVLEDTKKRSNSKVVWKCKCDCGTFTEVASVYLTHGQTKSCGCLKREIAKERLAELKTNPSFSEKAHAASREVRQLKLKGERFGRLSVIRETQITGSNGNFKWECLCDCGNVTLVYGSLLVRGITQSCGCLFKDYKENNVVDDTKLDNLTQKVRGTNEFGVKGISYNKNAKKFHAYIGFKRKNIYLGIYETLEEAIEARIKAEEEYFAPMLDKHERVYKVSENGSLIK